MSTLSKSEVQRQINMLNAKANGPGLTDTEREDFDRLCMAHEAMCRAEAQPARSAPTDLPGITAEIRRLARKNRTPAENAKFSALCRQSKSMNASRRAGEARAAKRSAGTTTPTGTTELQRVNADIRRLRAKGDSQTLNEVAHVKNLQRRAETLATAAARASAADDDEVVAQARKVLRQGQAKRGMSMVDPARATPGELRDGALKVLERDGKHLAPFQQDHLDRLLRHSDENSNAATIARRLLITESPAYRSAFRKVMNPAQSPVLDQAESRAVNEFRAANEGTGSAGGFGVPVLIDPTIILTSGASSAELLSMAKTVTITTDQWKGVTASDPAWSWRGEGAVASDSTLTMAQPTIPVYGATGWVEFSVELGQDYPDFAGEMRSLLGQGYIDLVANASVVGSGSSQPTGIFTRMMNTTTSPSHVVVTTAGQLGAVDVRKAWAALPQRFRGNAAWVMAPSTESLVRGFASGSSEVDYHQTLTPDGVTISALAGRPLVTSDYAPTFAGVTSGTTAAAVVGDFSAGFIVANRAGLNVELVQNVPDPTTGRPSGQRGWYATARVGFDAIPAAFRVLANS